MKMLPSNMCFNKLDRVNKSVLLFNKIVWAQLNRFQGKTYIIVPRLFMEGRPLMLYIPFEKSKKSFNG